MFSSKNKHRKMQDPLSFTFCWGETFDTVPLCQKLQHRDLTTTDAQIVRLYTGFCHG